MTNSTATLNNAFMASSSFNTTLTHASDNIFLTECEQANLIVTPRNVTLTPPYTLWSFAVGQVPREQRLGSLSRLEWTIPYAAGTQVIFFLRDAAGNIDQGSPIHTIWPGNSTDCLASSNNSAQPYMSLTAPNSAPGATCTDASLLLGGGGLPPYSGFVLGDPYPTPYGETGFSQLPDTLNLTQFGPAIPLIFAVQDSNHVWSNTVTLSTPITTAGTDADTVNCTITWAADPTINALVTPSIAPAPTSASAPTETSMARKTMSPVGAIAGGAVGGLIVIAALAALFFCFFKRKRRAGPGILDYEEPMTPTKEKEMHVGASNTPYVAPMAYAPSSTAGDSSLSPASGYPTYNPLASSVAPTSSLSSPTDPRYSDTRNEAYSRPLPLATHYRASETGLPPTASASMDASPVETRATSTLPPQTNMAAKGMSAPPPALVDDGPRYVQHEDAMDVAPRSANGVVDLLPVYLHRDV